MKTQLNESSILVTAFAEAWRNLQQAEKAMKDVKDAFRDVLVCSPVEYTFADGATVDFKLIEGHRTNPVGYDEAKEVTGFGEARMRQIAGNVDPVKVKALANLGLLTEEQMASILPVASYLQIRGTFRK